MSIISSITIAENTNNLNCVLTLSDTALSLKNFSVANSNATPFLYSTVSL